MKRIDIRVEPILTYLDQHRNGPIYPVFVAGETAHRLGLRAFDPGAKSRAGKMTLRS